MIKFKRLTDTAMTPQRATEGAAGFDLRYDGKPIAIYPNERLLLNTGIAMQLPSYLVGLIKPRSGLAVRYGINTLAGVIDSDYRNEIKVLLINHGERTMNIDPNMRIAQLVVTPFFAESQEVENLEDSLRGAGGFGSSGLD